jgi:hypothetical protein
LPTSTLAPLGEVGNPLRLAVVAEEFDQIQLNAAIELASQLDSLTGYHIQAEMVSSYTDVVDGCETRPFKLPFCPP